MTEDSMAQEGGFEPREVFKVRSYQLEMLEESMKRNIIVAMETGAGKTAILRIQAELERCPPEKLPAFHTRILSGADNLEHWTIQTIWDDVLKDIRIVISTHQVLLDALTHGFVRMKRLALLVFDEAHSCIGDHPSSRILRDFFHMSRAEERPAILGLTASPVVNSKIGNLEELEKNLSAISRSPKLHRDELLLHVHPPTLTPILYPTSLTEHHRSSALISLKSVYQNLDIDDDPWIIKMRSDPSTCSSKALAKAIISGKTYCHDQIKALYDKALAIQTELGSSATDYYIAQCIQKFQAGAAGDTISLAYFEDDGKTYLRKILSDVQMPRQEENSPLHLPHISPKVQLLIDFLMEEDTLDISGLIFVRTRAEVAVLSHLLAVHTPSFEISTFVGISSFSGRKAAISELAEARHQKTTLDDLRHGRKNLIVTTNALEEGIDVSRCKLVICFDRPPNLKSFIQRRGRARKSDSKYVIMFESEPAFQAVPKFTALEAQMKEIYIDDTRRLKEVYDEEETTEEIPPGQGVLFVESTGAKLTLDDAVQHLHHFCATLPAVPYVDRNPMFFFEDHSPGISQKSISATVMLPNSVDASLRKASGRFRWRTEKMAKRDAAFETYKALYDAGLIDDHLLPLGHIDEGADEAYSAVEKRPSLVEAAGQLNPWVSIAREWQRPCKIHASKIKIIENMTVRSEMLMLLPRYTPSIAIFDLHWSANTAFKVVVEQDVSDFDPKMLAIATQCTTLLLSSVFLGRMDIHDDFSTLFVPYAIASLEEWVQGSRGTVKADGISMDMIDTANEMGLIRDLSNHGFPYVFQDVTYDLAEDTQPDTFTDFDVADMVRDSASRNMLVDLTENEALEETHAKPHDLREGPMEGIAPNVPLETNDHKDSLSTTTLLRVIRFPKKIDLLHYEPAQDKKIAHASKSRTLLADCCTMSKLPIRYSQFAMFIPSILHRVQVALVVDHLCEGLLSPLQPMDRNLVTTAVSASSANEGTDYQRLEFFGDSMLKYMTSLALMAGHLNWHEGILSRQKDHIVSNSSLTSAALKTGLDRYILTKAFTGRKWRPSYNSSVLEDQTEGKREMSSKTLADVVEALIGAAYLNGGPQQALTCLRIFVPDVDWIAPSEACQVLHEVYELQIQAPTHLAQTEHLIAYSFTCKMLLMEALTHASHHGPYSSSSYQRLEFLGDAILDNIVTRIAYAHEPLIPTHKLHLIRTALVNGNFLGFLCLHHSIPQTRIDPVASDSDHISTIETTRPFHLWQSMRHASPAVSFAQRGCVSRYETLQPTITYLLTDGSHYPWSALARLEPPKPMSDIIESLIGAIYIDTQGSLPACESFLEILGLMPYLRRVMEGNVGLLHPKEELGQLADRERVRYETGREEEGREQRLWCEVFVGESKVVRVGNGLSVTEVQTRAADEACRILRERMGAGGVGGSGRKVERGGHGRDRPVEEEEEKESEVSEDESGWKLQKRKDHRQIDEDRGGRDSDSDVYMTADE